MNSRKVVTRKVRNYEVGRTIGEGTFVKVKFAQNMEIGESMAMKVLEKGTILRNRMVDQIKKDSEVERLSLELNELQKSKRELLEVVEHKSTELNEKNNLIKNYLDKIASSISGKQMFYDAVLQYHAHEGQLKMLQRNRIYTHFT